VCLSLIARLPLAIEALNTSVVNIFSQVNTFFCPNKHFLLDHRSDGASTSNARIARRRSISITPEISDDIVRAVRAMSESMRQNRLSRGQNDGTLVSSNDSQKHEPAGDPHDDEVSTRRPSALEGLRRQINSQKAVSLPSSPHRSSILASDLRGPSDFTEADLMSTWNKVLQSSPFLNKPLLPYEEWCIEFSEITVGIRVGVGK